MRINDRGPYAHNRIIDLSRRSAQLLGVIDNGTARVRVQILADESRALAMQMRGQQPTETVATAGRAARPDSNRDAAAPGSKDKPKQVSATPPPKPATTAPPAAAAPSPPSPLDGAQLAKQQVQTVPVKATQIFIQAGAFQRFDNAHKLSATLSPLGPTNVTQVDTKAGPMFRVRLGPIKTVNEADALLERVIGAGHPDARIVVD